MSDAHSSDDVLPPPGNDLDGLFDDPPVLASEATISRPLAEPLSDDDDAGGLFGDDDDDEYALPHERVQPASELTPSPARPSQRAQSPGLTKEELAHRQRLEYDEDGEDENMEVVKKQEAVAQVELANFGIPTTSKVWHARLPNFLSLQTQAFDEVMWEPEEIEEPAPSQSQEGPESTPGTLDTPGTPKTTVPDENVIRWRWVKDAQGNVVGLFLLYRSRRRKDSRTNPVFPNPSGQGVERAHRPLVRRLPLPPNWHRTLRHLCLH